MIFDISECEEKIGYSFKDKNLLRRCFTHSSYANEHGEDDNELLEFFGDAIIKFIDSEYLYKNSNGDEGKLTEKRKDIESNKSLLDAVKRLKIDKCVLLGNGQMKDSHDGKLYSSVYEALVAGIYLDGGLKEVKDFISRTLINNFIIEQKKKAKNAIEEDYKSAFQEYVQKRKMGSISYETLGKKGPDHNPEFRVVALLNGNVIAEGKGSSKKQAEKQSAKLALKKLIKQGGKQN